MIERYRNRNGYVEFDWREGPCLLLYMRYFPRWDKVYWHKAASEHKRKVYYYTYKLDDELMGRIETACREQFGVKLEPKG